MDLLIKRLSCKPLRPGSLDPNIMYEVVFEITEEQATTKHLKIKFAGRFQDILKNKKTFGCMQCYQIGNSL